MSSSLPNPLALTHDAFVAFSRAQGETHDNASHRYSAFHRSGTPAPGGFVPEPVRVHTTDSPEGPVHKFLLPVPAKREDHADPRLRLRLIGEAEHLETESVVIPMCNHTGVSHTLCVSSQIGCAMGCTFCETAQMGLIRSLTAEEIVAQWWAARHHLGHTIRNIVFMGMGEPLDNIEAVIEAVGILTDHRGPSITMRRITISTVGRLDALTRLREQARRPGWRGLNLAVSINAPNDEIRSRIMPINRAMPLADLVAALKDWPARKNQVICCEYVLIPGVNDADEHADELSSLLKGVRCCVNVIPYNPRRDSPWPAPTEESVWRFLKRLEANGQFCKRRRTKGRDSMAACGQLGNERIRNRRLLPTSV